MPSHACDYTHCNVSCLKEFNHPHWLERNMKTVLLGTSQVCPCWSKTSISQVSIVSTTATSHVFTVLNTDAMCSTKKGQHVHTFRWKQTPTSCAHVIYLELRSGFSHRFRNHVYVTYVCVLDTCINLYLVVWWVRQ